MSKGKSERPGKTQGKEEITIKSYRKLHNDHNFLCIMS